MMNENQEWVDLVLETLSFYEPMSLEKIILDIDSERIKDCDDFNKELLENILKELVSYKLVKDKKIDGEKTWVKVFRHKRSWWQRLFTFFDK